MVEKDDNLTTLEVNGTIIRAISDYAVGDRVYVLIRPEDITFTLAKSASSARNVFEGDITRMIPVGPLTRIEVDCSFPLFGVVTKWAVQELDIAVGKKVYASFKATAIHIIGRWN